MVRRDDIAAFCNDTLDLHKYSDFGPMGLQFIGSDKVTKLACAVSVSKEIIEATHRAGANMLLVHHGMFWNNESRLLDIRVGGRLELLRSYDISILAYHLALDGHPKIGNNILAARALGLGHLTPWEDIGWYGEYKQPMYKYHFQQRIQEKFDPINPMYFWNGSAYIKRVAVIVGGAAQYVVQAHRDGMDTFFTGEPSEPSYHLSSDLGINLVAAGHNITEQAGIQKLTQKVAQRFNLPYVFIGCDNPV